MKIVCGIDEAGRGPVLGPMVIAGVSMQEEALPLLASLGVRDSKLCTPKKREELYEAILEIADTYKVEVIGPREIDDALLDPSMNLNLLEIVHQAAIIDLIRPQHVILDCPGVNIESYTACLLARLRDKTIHLQAEHKADVNHPIVSAASIVAKVTRDREIVKLKERIGIDFGSGYPSDPKTRAFLVEYKHEHDEIKRKTWKTFTTLAL
jgi:ribonuclease HII